jgi:hypothetical protein
MTRILAAAPLLVLMTLSRQTLALPTEFVTGKSGVERYRGLQ